MFNKSTQYTRRNYIAAFASAFVCINLGHLLIWFDFIHSLCKTEAVDFLKYCFLIAIDDLMTPEEKDKLFTAIGYSESTHNLTLPKQVIIQVVIIQVASFFCIVLNWIKQVIDF